MTSLLSCAQDLFVFFPSLPLPCSTSTYPAGWQPWLIPSRVWSTSICFFLLLPLPILVFDLILPSGLTAAASLSWIWSINLLPILLWLAKSWWLFTENEARHRSNTYEHRLCPAGNGNKHFFCLCLALNSTKSSSHALCLNPDMPRLPMHAKLSSATTVQSVLALNKCLHSVSCYL
jgi:hypothetical protein